MTQTDQRAAAIQSDALLFTVEEAARVLGIGRTTLYQLMETGQLRDRKFGRARRIPRGELDRLANSDLLGGWAIGQQQSECRTVPQDQ